MRCDQVLDILLDGAALSGRPTDDGEYPAGVQEHVRGCPSCASAARDWQLLRLGLEGMAAEPVPDPSLGFARRVARRLGETEPARVQEAFFERVGRRFVYAALLLAVTLLLALVLPATGP